MWRLTILALLSKLVSMGNFSSVIQIPMTDLMVTILGAELSHPACPRTGVV